MQPLGGKKKATQIIKTNFEDDTFFSIIICDKYYDYNLLTLTDKSPLVLLFDVLPKHIIIFAIALNVILHSRNSFIILIFISNYI